MNLNFVILFCAGLAVAGCVDEQVSRAQPPGQTDAAKLSLKAIGKPENSSIEAAIKHAKALSDDKAIKILERMCGPRFINNYDGTYHARLKEQQRHRDRIPKITECYAMRGAEAWDMRIAQRAYIDATLPALQPSVKVKNLYLPGPSSIDHELATYHKELAEAPQRMRRVADSEIRDLARKRKANRQSWSQAFANAAPSFGQTLNSGTSRSTLAPTRTASLYLNASPAAVIAMDNMDRTVFGDAAVNQRILNETLAAARYSQARQSASGATITLTETKYCEYHSDGGSCISRSEWEARQSEAAKRRHAAYTSDALRRRAEMAAESQRIAAERNANLPDCFSSGCR